MSRASRPGRRRHPRPARTGRESAPGIFPTSMSTKVLLLHLVAHRTHGELQYTRLYVGPKHLEKNTTLHREQERSRVDLVFPVHTSRS
jgi:hypothetical protein